MHETKEDNAFEGNLESLEEMDHAVSSMLSNEFLKLSFDERTSKLEEMHGVMSQAVKETPSLVKKSLLDFQKELDRMVFQNENENSHHQLQPPRNTYVIMTQHRRCRNEHEHDHEHEHELQANSNLEAEADAGVAETETETERKIRKNNNHYALDDPDFRLRFLRCELFDVPKAAVRFWKYLDFTRECWGDIVLERPVGIEDILRNKEDKRYLKEGYVQILPCRDRSGRRIVTLMGRLLDSDDPEVVNRVIFFVLDSLTRDSVESQRLGAVIVHELHHLGITKVSKRSLELMVGAIACQPTRLVSVHMSLPDSIMARMFVNMTLLHGYKDNALGGLGFIIHKGSVLETRYELGSFGIPTQLFPMTDTGNLKVNYLNQWIKLRKILEQKENERRSKILGAPLLSERSSCADDDETVIVECPCLNDIVFRQGTPSWDNPGNSAFRDLILEHCEKKDERKQLQLKVKLLLQLQSNSDCGNSGDLCVSTAEADEIHANNSEDQIFCDWLLDEILLRRKGRFLEWNKTRSAWTQMNSTTKQQRGKIRQKVSIAIYHCGRSWNSSLVLKQARADPKGTAANSKCHSNANANGNAKRTRIPTPIVRVSPKRTCPTPCDSANLNNCNADDGNSCSSNDENTNRYVFRERGQKPTSSLCENNPCSREPMRKRQKDNNSKHGG
eukprot:jgi/Psemu1/29150/gm1.29150_g